jgi:hypothetical protein
VVRVAVVVCFVAIAGLSGCLSAKDADTQAADAAGAAGSSSSSSGTKSTTGTKAGGSTSATATGAASARTASLAASVVNGTAPLAVNFTVEATGNPQFWTLSFGDGTKTNGTGSALPATVNHTFAAGAFQANLTVLYPDGATLARNVTLNVTGGATGEVLVDSVPFSADGLILVGTQGDGVAVFSGCGFTDTEDLDMVSHAWDLGASVIGSGAAVTKFVVHMDLGASNVDADIYLKGPGGEAIGESADFNVLTQSPTEDFEVTGSFPAGTYTFEVRGCTTVAGEYSITATASIGTA